jgi:DNA replication and repair protein RecF
VFLDKLYLQNLRNLDTQTLEFGAGFNYLYGANGAGKTAVLEAIHLLARGRSFRSHKVAPIISYAEQSLIVRGEIVLGDGQRHTLAMSKSRSGLTELRLNTEQQSRASALAKYMPVLTLLPDAAELVLGGPGERRGFLDWGLFHVEPQFLDLSRNYRRVLKQRNAWLKGLVGENADLTVDNDPWRSQLLSLGQQINRTRADYLDRLRGYFGATLAQLSPELQVSLEYYWGGLVSVEESEKKLGESWLRDVKFGMTHRGPHRCDLLFTLEGHQASDVVSRGQAKLIASAAILAQAELLYRHSNIKSLFLIDDFGAELDAEHWRHFLRTLLALECQVIASSTEPLDIDQDWVQGLVGLQVFHVEQGKIT